jgi:hypothetical protein
VSHHLFNHGPDELCICGHDFGGHYSTPGTEIPFCIGPDRYDDTVPCGCHGFYSLGDYLYDLACSENRTPKYVKSPWKRERTRA